MPRIAVVDRERFNPENTGLMINLCPVNRQGTECITRASDGKIYIDEKTCIGCGICVNRDTEKSIAILNLPEELCSRPVHRHGKNGFCLYNLPAPELGKVVGIIGRNSIGKSTALNILAGMLKPNLGNTESEINNEEVMEFFRGNESRKFFEMLKAGSIKVSYKPQQVDLIPKRVSGKVREVLSKLDEKNILDKVVSELDLERVLENDINNVSGGELQRIAIAACVLKKASIYFFDEPTSFLDIKQRIKVSKFIRGLVNQNTGVMVVEHDLVILDYMTDMVYLMYGQEGVYGVVSGIKAARTGINSYLDGYIKEENMRFRDKPIKFIEKTEERKRSKELRVSWEGMKKSLGKFSFSSETGTINKEDVIGILGENGIGKTTFMRLIAGVDKPDAGIINEKVVVSYKPQYIDTNSEETVEEILKDAISKYSTVLINPLGIERLLARKVKHLSGGELQRVAIASCLSKRADLYLLDEPSAYLDIEQRLMVSKILYDFIMHTGTSCIVVDHDLLFLDYFSERLIVFEGKPAIKGEAKGPFEMAMGMNSFLSGLGITFRRDPDSGRPRANKPGSVKDREQKEAGNYYYT